MKDVDQAISQISSIRAQMAASTRFLGLSPEFNLFMGALALAVALLQSFILPATGNLGYVGIWSAVMMATISISTLDVVSRARKVHGRLATTMLINLLQKFAPFLLSMMLITWVICNFSVANVWLLPGLWQLLLALMGFAALPNLPRGMIWICAWYFVTGMVVLVAAAQTEVLAPWMMGVPFLVGQVAVGLILAFDKASEGRGV